MALPLPLTQTRQISRSPVSPEDRLQLVAADPASAAAAAFAETFNANVEKLNARMFTFLDYAIVGRR